MFDVLCVTCDVTLGQVFFLKVDGFSADDARWEDGVGDLNFTWLRAPLTPPSCFDSVGVYEAQTHDVRLLQKSAASSKKMSFFARKKSNAMDDEENEGELEAALRMSNEARKRAESKVTMSEGIHTWVLCPFR
jgi:hypothetical protein